MAFPLPQSSALLLGSHFAVAFPGPASHQYFPLCIQPPLHGLWPLLCPLGLASLSLGFSPSPVDLNHCSGSCFMVLLLGLASAPRGLSECAPGAVSVAGKDTVLCLSVCPAMLGVQGLVGLCWQCPGYKLSSSLAWGEGHSSSRVAAAVGAVVHRANPRAQDVALAQPRAALP